MKRYLTLRPRVKAKDAPYHSSIASASKEKKENDTMRKLDEWNKLNEKNSA